jgi:hypothetical protein
MLRWTSVKHQGFITTNIVGGLGNQMFQVANLIATAQRNGLQPYLERAAWSDSCEASRPTYWDSALADVSHIPEVTALQTQHTSFDPTNAVVIPERRPAEPITGLDPNGHFRLIGFFQSDVYFEDAAAQLRAAFTPQHCLAAAADKFGKLVPNHDTQHTVALHVRRGDYLRMTDVFETLSHTYYLDALGTLFGRQLLTYPRAGRVRPIHCLVFSEDAAYAKTLCGVISTMYPAMECTFVDGAPQGAPPSAAIDSVPSEVTDMLLMSLCNDVVLANSSYGWWGAYLNSSPMSRVVAPATWFVQDPFPTMPQLYCDGWIIK